MSLRDRVVVVTGASAGVGRATARAFADKGAHVGLLARGPDGLKAARAEIEAMGRRALQVPTDMADADGVEAAAAAVESELGPIDVWVNNAMASVFMPLREISADDFKRVTEVTYLGYVYATQAALRRMLPRDRGTIVQVGSALAFRGIPLQAPYCGSKHAIQGFTESLRCELLHDRSGVNVTEVHLPALNTPQFHWVKTSLTKHPQPVPPIYQPEVAARAIVWAAEHPKRRFYVGLPTVLTVTAEKFVGGLLDRYLGRTGVASQQAKWPIEPGRPNNLYDPVGGDHGAHGEFDSRATARSPQLWVSMNRGRLGAIATALATAGWLVARRD